MTALASAERRLLRQAVMPRKRRQEPVFLAEGVRVVRDLAASSLEVRLIAALSSFWDTVEGGEVTELANARRVPCRTFGPEEISEITTTETPQPVVAVGRIPERGMDDLLAAGAGEPAVVLVLDAVQDPGNAGTMIRTAEALGVSGVAALPGTVDLWSPKVVRASAGALFRVPVHRGEIAEVVDSLRGARYQILVADAGGETLEEVLPGRWALVVGNEGAGVSAEILPHADRTVAVTMRGRAESLNVSAAAAILLHQLSQSHRAVQ